MASDRASPAPALQSDTANIAQPRRRSWLTAVAERSLARARAMSGSRGSSGSVCSRSRWRRARAAWRSLLICTCRMSHPWWLVSRLVRLSVAGGGARVVKASPHLCSRPAGVARYLLAGRRQELQASTETLERLQRIEGSHSRRPRRADYCRGWTVRRPERVRTGDLEPAFVTAALDGAPGLTPCGEPVRCGGGRARVAGSVRAG